MSLKSAQHAGYVQGYRDAMAGRGYNPKPPIYRDRCHAIYRQAFLEHYDKGANRARSDRDIALREKELLATRVRGEDLSERSR